MSKTNPTCNCNLVTRLVGDGCSVCNQELAAEMCASTQVSSTLIERLSAAHAETIEAARRVIDRHDKGLIAGKGDSLVIEQLRLCVERNEVIK